ncbi:TetR/AcrR family transcriptional regulator [Rhodococcus sp. NPDC059234]|uniref:TetR/AcrR family transcriptional regulator n=1 Tax=Rhodococcus sp. NPDC059234 TaxID=3346781 RepID=UPI00366FA2FB
MASKAARTRAVILEHGSRLASVRGLSDVSIGTLATDVQISKSGLYAHFRSKEALQLAVVDSAAERFASAVVAPAADADSPLSRLQRLLELWVDWTNSSMPGGCLLLSAAMEFDDRPGRVRDRLAELHQSWRALLESTITDATNAGELHPETDAGQLAFELTGMVLAYHQASRLMRDAAAERRVARALHELISGHRVEPSED